MIQCGVGKRPRARGFMLAAAIPLIGLAASGCGSGPMEDAYVWDRDPVLVERVEPEYPRLAHQAGIEDDIELSILVTTNGTVQDIEIIQFHTQSLAEAAAYAVVQWKYLPAIRKGKVVAERTTVVVEFRLSDV